jgi:hypothetical protein
MHCVILGTKQYPSNSLDQKFQSMVFTNYPHEGITFLLGFVWAMQYPSRSPWCLQKTPNKVFFSLRFWYGYAIPLHDYLDMLWNQRNLNIP